MQTLTVNILPISRKQDEDRRFQSFLTAMRELAESKYWNGIK